MEPLETCQNCNAVINLDTAAFCSECSCAFCDDCSRYLKTCEIHDKPVCTYCLGTNDNSDFSVCSLCIQRLVEEHDTIQKVRFDVKEALVVMDRVRSQAARVASRIDPALFSEEFIFLVQKLGVVTGALNVMNDRIKKPN